MVTFRIKDINASPLHWRMWNTCGEYLPYKRAERRNSAILKKLFTDTQAGTIKGFYTVTKPNKYGIRELMAWHRSPKNPGYVQLSVAHWTASGEFVPSYDVQYKNIEDFTNPYRHESRPGLYQIIK